MQIVWTDHARERLTTWYNRRGIRQSDVETLLRTPDQIVESYGGKRVAQTKRGDGLLRVVYGREGDSFVIVTLYWTSDVDKYWKS